MYFLLICVSQFIGHLSPKNTERFVRGLTFITWDVVGFRKKLILKNLNIAFGDEKSTAEINQIGKSSVFNFMATIVEFFRSLNVDISADVSFQGIEHIEEARKANLGAYILCWHMGNWEAMASAITRDIAPARLIVKVVGSKGVDKFVTKLRNQNGFTPIVRRKKGDGFKGIQKFLDEGDIIGFPMDQSRPGAPRLPFFGQPAKTNTSFAAIWSKRKAPIVPGYIHRKSIGHHEVRFFPEVKMQETNDPEKDVIANSVRFNQMIEKVVKEHPDQYLWFHDRWK